MQARTPKALTTAQYQALQAGLQAYCATTVFTIAGQTYTTATLVALITSILNVKIAVAPAKAAWLEATQAVDQAEAQNGQIAKGARDIVAVMFKNAPTTLATFAIVPRKAPTPLTTQQRAAANAKAEATRKARGTGGKKQKALVKGNVTGAAIIPITSSATAGNAGATPPVAPVLSTAVGGSTSHS